MNKFIVLVGTPSEGFAAYGPYESFDAAEEAHSDYNAFVLGLDDPKNTKIKNTKTKKEKSR